MKHVWILSVLLAIGCERGGPQLQFSLKGLANSSVDGGDEELDLKAGDVRTIELLALGAGAQVTFVGNQLPAFAQLQGNLLTLAPTRGDVGAYQLSISAQSAGQTATSSITVRVSRDNKAPVLEWVAGGVWMSDGSGDRLYEDCPSAFCLISGAPVLHIGAWDPDEDAFTIEVEVVPVGQPFTGTPTRSVTVPRGRMGGAPISVALPSDLAAGQTYAFDMRITDEFGAIAEMSPGNNTLGDHSDWLQNFWWLFQQGPCSGDQCSCSTFMCNAGSDCCSGKCVAHYCGCGAIGSECLSNADCCSGTCTGAVSAPAGRPQRPIWGSCN